jgi:D-alanyl-D-alanine carboxypeptidase/D-alanyl-D-alanine-endopeptidase (penicillin-binding protein 4)
MSAQPLPVKISALLDQATFARHGFWGIRVVDLRTGAVRFERMPDRPFVPASVAKLFSIALALERLGPEYRFLTTVTGASEPDAGGRLAGDLVLTGGGDPTMCARVFPYGKGSMAGNPLQAVESLADQVVARGVRRIDGDVAGDDTAYPWEPYPSGRAQEDSLWDYGAPVSALSVNENRITLTISPGNRAGEQARIRVAPLLDYFGIDNRVRTAAGGQARIEIERLPGSRQIRVWGSLPLGSAPFSQFLAIDDPAQYAAAALRDALIRRGVVVRGGAVARHRFLSEVPDLKSAARAAAPDGIELARRVSPPLAEILEAASKESLNLYTELVLREVGRMRRNIGSLQAGLEELAGFSRRVGVPEGDCALMDASGLSMLDLVTPRAVTALLAYMQASPNREAWSKLLAIGGEEGTLRRRFQDVPRGSVRAKTGSMAHVSTLAGYAVSAGGDTLAFAILVNNYTAPVSEIRLLTDRIVVLLVQQGN